MGRTSKHEIDEYGHLTIFYKVASVTTLLVVNVMLRFITLGFVMLNL